MNEEYPRFFRGEAPNHTKSRPACVGMDSDPATAHVARCILNPSRVKPDGRTTQLPPPFSHRPLHGCSHSGGFLCYVRHAHAHMHALHNVHMRVPYGIESLPKTRASLMQHCMVAASRVDPWPKLVFSATTDCALHPYVSTTYRRPIPRTRKQGRVFARRRRKIWKLGSETVDF